SFCCLSIFRISFFFFQAEDGIRDRNVTGVQTCALPIFTMSVLSACNSAKDMTEYIDVSFSGMDTFGSASYDVDEGKLISEVLDLDEDAQDFPDAETAEEAEEIASAYDVTLDEEED